MQPDYSDVSCLKHRLEQSNAPMEKKKGCSMHSAEGFFYKNKNNNFVSVLKVMLLA